MGSKEALAEVELVQGGVTGVAAKVLIGFVEFALTYSSFIVGYPATIFEETRRGVGFLLVGCQRMIGRSTG